jgi:glyoxylase-like metal-dependent hydrolase (beta-lactamase superfamily II)
VSRVCWSYNSVNRSQLDVEKETSSSKLDTGMCQEIAPGVHYREVGKGISRSNVYFVRSGSSWVLLFGAGARPVSILLTHDHPDHAGSALELARMWGCPVYVHPDELPLTAIGDLSTVERYANPLDRWIILPLLRLMPRRRVQLILSKGSLREVVQAFDPGATIPGLPDWQCIHTPGHTPGHVALFRTADRVLITGDAIVTADLNSFLGALLWGLRLNQQRASGPPWYSTWNKQAAKESVAALAALDPRVLASGHGVPMSGEETAGKLRAFADRFSKAAARKNTESGSRLPA